MNRITRREAHLRPPQSITERSLSDIEGVMFHYSAFEEGEDCVAQWQAVQKYHIDSLGWSDIGYHFGICLSHGHVLIGRGLKRVGAHCPGFNTSHVGIVFLCDDDRSVRELTPQARAAAVELVAWVEGKVGHGLPEPLGHRDGKATSCPGDEIYEWLRAGMPAPSQPPADGPQPAQPSPPAEPDRDVAEKVTITVEKAVLKLGSRGKETKQVQKLVGVVSDGVFGSRTRAEVKKFQLREGLTVTGVVNAETWKELLR